MPGSRSAETSIYLVGNRYLPREMVRAQAEAIAASGVVDHLMVGDQLNNFIPPELWTAENVPAAQVMPDPDSHADAWSLAAFGAAIAPELKITIMTDSVRHGPTELIQRMATLSILAGGDAYFQIGSGEAKQTKPFGWKRKEGLDRFEDLIMLFEKYWGNDGPIDFEGFHAKWTQATLGGAKMNKPHIWGLGAGPRLVDLATSHCEGLCVASPMVWATPEIAAEEIAKIRRMVEEKGRDPEEFKIGVGFDCLIHEDKTTLATAFDNPVIKWLTAALGRIDQTQWTRDGFEPPLRDNWKYYLHLVPHNMPEGEVAAALDKVTPDHVEAGWICGTPEKVASEFQAYVDAGVDWILVGDFLPLVLEPEDAAQGLPRAFDVCGRLKGGVTSAT